MVDDIVESRFRVTAVQWPSVTSRTTLHDSAAQRCSAFPLYKAIDQLKTYTPPPLVPALTTSSASYARRLYDPSGRLTSVNDSLADITRIFTYTPGCLPLAVATSDGETLTYGSGVDGPLLMSRTWSGLVSGTVAVTHDGLVRFGARDYDASVGRWGQKDPIRLVGGSRTSTSMQGTIR